MDQDLELFLKVAEKLVKEAGQIVRNRIWEKKECIETKAHATDFVTETDQQIEKLLITELSAKFPTHKFIGEETASSGVKVQLTDDPTWIIDPVDGTLNFVHGYPHVCISVGLTVKKEPVVGIIYVPIQDMLFTAIKGKGAYLNGRPIKTSQVKNLKDAILTFEVSGSSENKDRYESSLVHFQRFLPIIHGCRQSGSAAYNLGMVALGGCDCYFEIGIHAWDMAAGIIIVREAGGVALDTEGGPIDIMSRRLLAAGTEELALEVSKKIVQFRLERDDV